MPTTRTGAGGDATSSADESKVNIDVTQIIAELQLKVQELHTELNAQRVETTQAKVDAAAARSAALSSPSRSRTPASQVVHASSPPSGPKIREYLATITGKFNDHNWLAWSKETKTFLKIHNLWRGVIDRPDRTDVTFDQKNLNAYLIIKAGVEDHIGQQVRSPALLTPGSSCNHEVIFTSYMQNVKSWQKSALASSRVLRCTLVLAKLCSMRSTT